MDRKWQFMGGVTGDFVAVRADSTKQWMCLFELDKELCCCVDSGRLEVAQAEAGLRNNTAVVCLVCG
jgi:hypothetical protein